jgi:hypothetical protein
MPAKLKFSAGFGAIRKVTTWICLRNPDGRDIAEKNIFLFCTIISFYQ